MAHSNSRVKDGFQNLTQNYLDWLTGGGFTKGPVTPPASPPCQVLCAESLQGKKIVQRTCGLLFIGRVMNRTTSIHVK